jgi:hypothetical protein
LNLTLYICNALLKRSFLVDEKEKKALGGCQVPFSLMMKENKAFGAL